MNNNQLMIEITREDGKLSVVKVFMPVWQKLESDGKLYIKIPVFGLETCALNDEKDVECAIEEAVMCFCIAAEECGLGLESELEFMGWEKSDEGGHLFMDLESDKIAIKSIIDTGEQHAIQLDLINKDNQQSLLLDIAC
jgi:hypothetical protein